MSSKVVVGNGGLNSKSVVQRIMLGFVMEDHIIIVKHIIKNRIILFEKPILTDSCNFLTYALL